MAAGDDLDGEKPRRLRCLDAARYVVASVVTVLIVTVIVGAIVVVFRPDKLTLRVAGGSVTVVPTNSTEGAPLLICSFRLEAINPNGRARMYYTNITGSFFVNNTSTSQVRLAYFSVPEMVVGQHWTLGTNVQVYVKNTTRNMPYFNKFYKSYSSILPNKVIDLKLQGNLIVGLYSVHNQTDDQQTTYYCSDLTARYSSEAEASDNVECMIQDPSSMS